MFAHRLPLIIVLAAILSGATSAQTVDLTIALDGDQNGVATPGAGTGTLTFDVPSSALSWSITFEDLLGAQTAAHIHGPAGLCVSAPIIIGLPLGSPIVGGATLTPPQVADLLAGRWYVNIHTDLHPSGEIRGQIVPLGLADPIPAPIPASAVHVRLEEVATGLTAPNWGTSVPGDDRLFVTDQSGVLWAIEPDGAKTVFLDVTAQLVPLGLFGPGTFDERGLLGVAFHPEYASNGKLYTYTSEPAVGAADFPLPPGVPANHFSVITEWVVPGADPDGVVDPGSARVLMTIAQPQFNHNAGALAFDGEGLLLIGLGDGGGADDKDGQVFIGEPIVGHGCMGNAQNAENPLGSILRVDPSGSDSANGAYGIPPTNPFTAPGDPRLDEIYAYGLRNPFRLSVDAVTGAIHVADVGQNDIEEINIVIAGGNYGWNHFEGSFPFIPSGNQPGYVTDLPQFTPPDLVLPIAEYDHDEGIAIVGGFVYRGVRVPPLAGAYVFGEFAVSFSNDGRLFHLDGAGDIVEFVLVDQPALALSLLGFGRDASGELYVLANDSGVPFGTGGVVLRIATIPGDFDADGAVTCAELLQLLSNWGPCGACPEDIDGDGEVGFGDLLQLLSHFG